MSEEGIGFEGLGKAVEIAESLPDSFKKDGLKFVTDQLIKVNEQLVEALKVKPELAADILEEVKALQRISDIVLSVKLRAR